MLLHERVNFTVICLPEELFCNVNNVQYSNCVVNHTERTKFSELIRFINNYNRICFR